MQALGELRDQIDELDHRLIQILGERMEVAEKIGRYKKENGIAVLQNWHWEAMLKARLDLANQKGLDEAFITKLFRSIHQESIHRQRSVINQG